MDLKNIIYKFVINMFIYSNIFDMSGDIGVKYISLLFMIVLMLNSANKFKTTVLSHLTNLYLFVIWPLFSLFLSVVIFNNNYITAFNDFKIFGVVVFFIFLLNDEKTIKYSLSAIYRSSIVLSLIIIVINLHWLITSNIALINSISSILGENNAYVDLYIGNRDYNIFWVPRIYFRATLFIIIGYAYYVVHNKNLAITLTGKRPTIVYVGTGTSHALINKNDLMAIIVSYGSAQHNPKDEDTYRKIAYEGYNV